MEIMIVSHFFFFCKMFQLHFKEPVIKLQGAEDIASRNGTPYRTLLLFYELLFLNFIEKRFLLTFLIIFLLQKSVWILSAVVVRKHANKK